MKKFTGKSGTAWWSPADDMNHGFPTFWVLKWPGMIRVRWTIRPIIKRKRGAK